jgi:hypothetical protein
MSRVSPRLTLLTASGVCSLIVLDTNIVAVTLPTIARDLGANFADIEWVVSAYMLAFAALLLPAGSIADRFGRKKTLVWGLGIFILASLGCGAAPSVLLLDIARAVKGRRRCAAAHLGAGLHRPRLSRRGGTGQGLGILGRVHGRGHDRRADPGRLDHRVPGLALDFLPQPAGGPGVAHGAGQLHAIPESRDTQSLRGSTRGAAWRSAPACCA